MHRAMEERKQAVFTEQLRVVPFILQVSKHKCLSLFQTNHINVTSSAERWREKI